MFETRKELRRIENKTKANEQLNELTNALKEIDDMINGFYSDATELLQNNDESGFELVANSILYFQDIKSVIQTVRIHFKTYIKTAQFMGTIEGIRPVLKSIAKNMNTYPSLSKNNKDFAKFKKSLLRGQLNMKAMASMMKSVNPAAQTTRSKEELDALKERLLTSQVNNGLKLPKSNIALNDDFFTRINRE